MLVKFRFKNGTCIGCSTTFPFLKDFVATSGVAISLATMPQMEVGILKSERPDLRMS